ncbi:MAG: hypothetical protein AB8F78_03395 [Saprospiraceae bacterium]
MYKMIALFSFLLAVACSPDADPLALTPVQETTPAQDTLPGFGESETHQTYSQQLGVNFTWAADNRIDGDPTFASQAFTHVRYFQMMEKDYGDGTPATSILAPCQDLDNPWSCPDLSMRQHLVRVKSLRAMFPNGIIWVAPEVLKDRSWPCKGWDVDEMGGDPQEAGYQWAKAALATYGQVGGVVLAMTNEEWCAEAGRTNAYNEWRRGIIKAHRENPSCQLAIGARHVRQREWHGQRMPDNVNDVASDIWSYVNQIGGWADYHAHGIEDGRFLPHDQADEAEEILDFYAWSNWLDLNYSNIKKSVGEIAYTTSEPGVVATDAEKKADWPTYRSLVADLATKADLVFLYQIEDHDRPEGAFSGSGIYPALMPEVEAFGNEINERLERR